MTPNQTVSIDTTASHKLTAKLRKSRLKEMAHKPTRKMLMVFDHPNYLHCHQKSKVPNWDNRSKAMLIVWCLSLIRYQIENFVLRATLTSPSLSSDRQKWTHQWISQIARTGNALIIELSALTRKQVANKCNVKQTPIANTYSRDSLWRSGTATLTLKERWTWPINVWEHTKRPRTWSKSVILPLSSVWR